MLEWYVFIVCSALRVLAEREVVRKGVCLEWKADLFEVVQ